MIATELVIDRANRLVRLYTPDGEPSVDETRAADTAERHARFAALRALSQREYVGPAHVALSRAIEEYASSEAVMRNAIRRATRRSADPMPLYLANDLDVMRLPRSTRHGRWYFKAKPGGGHRRVCSLSARLTVAQAIAKDVIFALHTPGDHISDWPGRGPDHHHRNLIHDIQHLGPFVVRADVRDCYQNVRTDYLYSHKILPPAFVRSCLDHRRIRLRGPRAPTPTADGVDYSVLTRLNGPAGLLGGGPASNALWAVMIDDLPASMPDDVRAGTYADNIAVVCRDEPECERAEASLNRYFTDHPAGPFSLTLERDHIDDGFDHLGYLYLRHGNDVHLTPADFNLGKMMRRLEVAHRSACASGDPSEFAAAVERELACARLAHPAFQEVLRLEAMAFGGGERRDDDGGDLPPIFGANSASHINPPSVPRWSCEPRR